jgi:hypothetical protein
MAQFTMELREIVYNDIYASDRYKHYNILDESWALFDEDFRPILNTYIKDHFYFREIGLETADRFRFVLNRYLRELMPAYNELYKSTMADIDMSLTWWQKSSGVSTREESAHSDAKSNDVANSTGDGTSDATGESMATNTPQTMLNAAENYASSGGWNKSHSENTSTTDTTTEHTQTSDATSNDLNKYINEISGRNGLAGDILASWRDNIINVTMQLMDELEPCFMQLLANYLDHPKRRLYGAGARYYLYY